MFPETLDMPPTGEKSIAYTSAIVDDQTHYAFSNTDYYRYTAEREDDIIRRDTQLQLRRQFDRLLNQVQVEWLAYREYFAGINLRDVQEVASKLLATVLHTSPEKVALEFTADATIFFTFMYPGLNAYMEVHFDPDEETEIVINAYTNKKPVFAYGGTLTESLQAFYSYLTQR